MPYYRKSSTCMYSTSTMYTISTAYCSRLRYDVHEYCKGLIQTVRVLSTSIENIIANRTPHFQTIRTVRVRVDYSVYARRTYYCISTVLVLYSRRRRRTTNMVLITNTV